VPTSWPAGLGRLRRPEYTGENRCQPCTLLNIAIASILAVLVAVWAPFEPLVSDVIGAGFLLVSYLAIGLRGYLVPGTPWFTRTHFPPWLLDYFDHREPASPGRPTVEPATVLEAAGAVTECETHDDLCLTDDFRGAWQRQMAALEALHASRSELADMFDLDAKAIQLEDHGQAFVAIATDSERPGRQRLGQWESAGAFTADMAGARVLAERFNGWAEIPTIDRGRVLHGLRVFLDRCPTCGGAVRFGEETVRSCCRSADVAAVTCEDCGARLFEAEQPGGA